MQLLLLSLHSGAVEGFLGKAFARAELLRARSASEDERDPLPARSPRVGYITDAAAPYRELPFVNEERERIAALGYPVEPVEIGELSPAEVAAFLGSVDALYVAGGNTFVLLQALKRHGADSLIVDAVRRGLPYVGCSAGSIVAGPSIEPASLMDDPRAAPDLTDYRGLALIDEVIVPHADGALPSYPLQLIGRIAQDYSAAFSLRLLCDDEALHVTETTHRVMRSAFVAMQ